MTHDRPHVSRRTIVQGAAWAVPTVAAATLAPLVAASPIKATGCFTLKWNTGGLQTISSGTQGTNATRSGTLTANVGATGTLTATVSQNRTAGAYSGPASFLSNTTGDFGVATAGTTIGNVYASQESELLPSSPGGLILNQAPSVKEGLTSRTARQDGARLESRAPSCRACQPWLMSLFRAA